MLPKDGQMVGSAFFSAKSDNELLGRKDQASKPGFPSFVQMRNDRGRREISSSATPAGIAGSGVLGSRGRESNN